MIVEEIKRIARELQELSKCVVHVGLSDDEDMDILVIAHVHEYGCVTKSIPERSFIRASYDNFQPVIEQACVDCIDNVLERGMAASEAMEILGQKCLDMTLEYFRVNIPPPNNPQTIADKGSSLTLHDTGVLEGKLKYWIDTN